MAFPQARNWKDIEHVPYTAAAAIVGGCPTPVFLADRAVAATTTVTTLPIGIMGIPHGDLAIADIAEMQIKGRVRFVHTASLGNAGDNVWWDNNGDPYGGTAGTGAATTKPSAGDYWLGILAKACTITDPLCEVLLNEINPYRPPWVNRFHELLAATTLTTDIQDHGKVIHFDHTAATVVTLQATVVGTEIIFVNDTADGALGFAMTLSPNASDAFAGPNWSPSVNKDLVNTAATHKRGDWVHLRSSGTAAYGWYIVEKSGLWTGET